MGRNSIRAGNTPEMEWAEVAKNSYCKYFKVLNCGGFCLFSDAYLVVICMYVCMYVCMYLRMYVRTYVRTYVRS